MKKTIKKVISLLLVILIIMPTMAIGSMAASEQEINKAIVDLVNDSRKSFINTANSQIQLANNNLDIVKKIQRMTSYIDWSWSTISNLAFTFVSPDAWLDLALDTSISAFGYSLAMSIVNTGGEYVEKGKYYYNRMIELYNNYSNKQGKITDHYIARQIFQARYYGGAYLLHGIGYWTPTIEDYIGNPDWILDSFVESVAGIALDCLVGFAGDELAKKYPKIKKWNIEEIYSLSMSGYDITKILFDNHQHLSSYPLNIDKIEKELKIFLPQIKTIPKYCLNMDLTYPTYTTSFYYDSSKYMKNLKNVRLTGNQADDIVNIALSQVGYHEGFSKRDLGGGNLSGNKNYTEYAYWFGTQVKNQKDGHWGAWCAMFISWCARQARIPVSTISNAAYAKADGSNKLGGYSNFHIDFYSKGKRVPKKGDLIFFGTWNEWKHVGLVQKVEGNRVYTIEGNTKNNKVELKNYPLSDSSIKGYGVPKYTNKSNNYVSSSSSSYDYYNPNSHYSPGKYVVNVNSYLNCRKSPTTNSASIYKLYNGDIVDVTSTNGNWGYTKYGWICLDYTIYQDKLTTEFYNNVNYNTGNYYVTATRGLNVRKSPNTNSTILYAISKGTDFSVTEVDGSWGYSPEMGGWLCLNYAEWLSDLEPEIPVPETPILTTKTSSVIGVGEIISVEWEKVDFTDSYTLKLIDTKNKNVVETKSGVTGTTASFVAPYEGCYDVSIVAVNSKHTSTESRIYNITAQAPSIVTFKNWDGSIISTQNVAYGKDATAPATPSREGYTFSKWDGDLKKVQEDRTITATYTRNKYKVTFCDYDGTFISTQDVYYGDAATAPKYSAPTGYSFVKWDTNFDNITNETTVKAVISWTSLYPLEISTSSLVERNNKSYIVTSIVNNSPNTVNNARVIAVLKTTENKLLATVQSENISLAKGEVKNLTLIASYESMATKAEIFVVKADNENIPLAKHLTKDVDQGTAWSSWSTSKPPVDALQVESRTEYRYRDKDFKTSSSSSMSGYTQYDHTYTWSSWSSWSPWQDSKISAITSEDVETQRQVKTQSVDDTNSPIYETKYNYKTVYHYYHYSTQRTGASESDKQSSSYPNYYPFDSDVELTHYDYPSWCSPNPRYYYYYNAKTPNTVSGNWTGVHKCNPFTTQEVASSWKEIVGYNKKTQYSYQTRNKNHTYYFYKWGDWSNWSPETVSGTDSREVEKRTTYRYLANTTNNIETTEGSFVERKGFVDKSYSNRQALLFVMDKNGTPQFVGQTIIGTDGSYAFKFKTKDEPSVESGDYNVTLSIEGTSASISLDPIKAPVPKYTVTIKNFDGAILETQQIAKGENAILPQNIIREGYNFIGWSSSGTNIQEDTVIVPVYEIMSFDVIFVDEINKIYQETTYNYGDTLVPPEVNNTEAYTFIGWDCILNGITNVTESIVVTAIYEVKTYNVTFYDFEGKVLQKTNVAYGDGVNAPELTDISPYIFVDWDYTSDIGYITEDMNVYPIFEYENTVDAPTSNVETGTYNEQQVVTLSCATEGADIYYTLDGSDPLESNESTRTRTANLNGILYTGPFSVDSSVELVYVAIKQDMNQSDSKTNLLSIQGEENQKHLVSVYSSLWDEPREMLINTGETVFTEDTLPCETGYKLLGAFKDEAMTSEWNIETDAVTQSMNIYLKFEKETYTVEFLDKNDSVISKQNVAFCEFATAPEAPEVEGYVFVDWDKDYLCVSENMEIRPVYAKAESITTITLSDSDISLFVGDEHKLVYAVELSENSTNGHVYWYSEDENIVTVNEEGHIVAIGYGETIIYGETEDSGYTVICNISVKCKHDYSSKVTAPTCTEKGYTTYTCSVCGDAYTANEKASLGHNMSEVIPILAPSCENEGQNMIKCIRCEYSEIQQIEATGHCDNDGNNICDDCGKELSASSKCSCNCHKTGFMSFIWKILRFFYKLFGMNKVCGCGVSHY